MSDLLKTFEDTNPEEAAEWFLRDEAVDCYREKFLDKAICGRDLLSFELEELLQELEVQSFGHRKIIQKSWETLKTLHESSNWSPDQVATFLNYLNPRFKAIAFQSKKIQLTGDKFIALDKADLHKQLHLNDNMARVLHQGIQNLKENAVSPVEDFNDALLKEAFICFDHDSDGFISFRDLCFCMEDWGITWEIDQAKKAFKAMDTKKTKKVDYESFQKSRNSLDSNVQLVWTVIMRRFFNQENVIQNNGGGKLPEKDFSLEEIVEELKDRGENWQKRVNMMKQMPNLLAQLDEISYGAIFADVAKCLIIQLQDRRTTIVPVAADCLCKIFGDPEKLHISLHSLAEIVQSGLFQCIRTKIKIIHDSGVKASIELATELPLDQDDLALRAFVTGTKEKHGQVRKTCFDCIKILLDKVERTPDNFERGYWTLFSESLGLGISDPDSDARKSAFLAMAKLEKKNRREYTNIFLSLSPRKQKSLNRATGKKQKKKRMSVMDQRREMMKLAQSPS